MKALSIKPNSADGNINLAHLLRVTGRFHEADAQYEKALSLRPNHPQLNYFHGVVLEKLGKRKVKVKRILLGIAVLFLFFSGLSDRDEKLPEKDCFLYNARQSLKRRNRAQISQNVRFIRVVKSRASILLDIREF